MQKPNNGLMSYSQKNKNLIPILTNKIIDFNSISLYMVFINLLW